MKQLTLVSHHLCPYAQRAAIAMTEQGMAFERINIDLSNKPAWFQALSPLGKVPLLRVAGEDGETVIFESAVILEYLEDTGPAPLHPQDPLERARHRAWMEYGSSILNRIGALYSAASDADLVQQARQLDEAFARVEDELGAGPWFAGTRFSLVDVVFGPIFRYFDVFDRIDDFEILAAKPRLAEWRAALAARPSVRDAVAADYPARLMAFVINRGGALGKLAAERAPDWARARIA